MEVYGPKVIVVEDRDPAGGYLGSRLKKIDQILQTDPNAVWLNQYANIANKNVHAEQTANEIAREFDKVDWVFVETGCPYRKSNPHVLMVQSTKHGPHFDAPVALDVPPMGASFPNERCVRIAL